MQVILPDKTVRTLPGDPVAIEKLLLAAERRIPVIYTPCPIAGATVPMTLAGALVVAVADSLSGLVAAQFSAPGAPFIMGGVLSTMDMSSTIYTYGSPEFSLLEASLTDLAHFYRLPMFSTAGCSDSKIFDGQVITFRPATAAEPASIELLGVKFPRTGDARQ